MANLEKINSLPAPEASAEFLRCCGSARWASAMTGARPFPNKDRLLSESEKAWFSLEPADWLEAFSHHPKIGDIKDLRERFAQTREWAKFEQAGVGGANEQILASLSEGNREYEAKYGYIFIICASGKSAGEILKSLQERLNNDRQSELVIAAEEQRKIMRLRLEKMLEDA